MGGWGNAGGGEAVSSMWWGSRAPIMRRLPTKRVSTTLPFGSFYIGSAHGSVIHVFRSALLRRRFFFFYLFGLLIGNGTVKGLVGCGFRRLEFCPFPQSRFGREEVL